MTTGVFRGEIYMTLLHSPGPKIGGRCKLQTARLSFTGTELYRFEVSIGRRPLMQFKKKIGVK